MKKIWLLFPSALLALALTACSSVPGSSPIAVPSGLPTVPPASDQASLAGQGLAQACDSTSNTSLSGIADRLRNLGADPDTAALTDAIATLTAILQGVEVPDVAAGTRDEAIDQLRQMQSALAEPGTAGDVAAETATRLETLESQVCV